VYYSQLVEKLFQGFLGRSPAPQELTDWVGRLEANTDAGHPITTSLLEFLNSDASLQTWVARWLKNYLGESGTLDQLRLSSDVGAAVTRLTGGADFQDVLADLLASDQFYQAAGGTDAGFLKSLYQAIVERAPTDTELSTDLGQLANGTRQDVIRSLLQSTEAARTQVAHWFADYLGRGPSLADIE
jgi:hypothetical protein